MIKCPECGEQAPDGAKFCDRCGRGLDPASVAAAPVATRPLPLAAGTILKGKFEIVEPIAGTSIENRYRARRIGDDKSGSVILRERLGPTPVRGADSEDQVDSQIEATTAPDADTAPLPPPEIPNGPRAKTAELEANARCCHRSRRGRSGRARARGRGGRAGRGPGRERSRARGQ